MKFLDKFALFALFVFTFLMGAGAALGDFSLFDLTPLFICIGFAVVMYEVKKS